MNRSFLLITLVMFLASCGHSRHEWHELGRAEALTVAEPDSAYAILDGLSYSGNDRELAARLQLAKADCVYYSDVLTADNDSAISAAISYFENHGAANRLARAYFLRANQRADVGAPTEAIVDLLHAEKYAVATKDSVSLGLIYRAMSESYEALEDMASAVAYIEKSYNIFKVLKSERYLDWITYDYGRNLSNALRYDEAESIFLMYINRAFSESNHAIYNECMRMLGSIYNFKNEHNKAVDYFQRYTLSKYPEINRHYWTDYGRSLVEVGQIDEAKAMQDSLSKYFPDEYYLRLRIAQYEGDKDEITRAMDAGLKEQNEAFEVLYRREFANVIDSYYKEQLAVAAAREARERMEKIAICAVAVALGLVLWMGVRRSQAERRAERATLRMLQESVRVKEDERREAEATLRMLQESVRVKEDERRAAEVTVRQLAESVRTKEEEKRELKATTTERLRELNERIKVLVSERIDHVVRLSRDLDETPKSDREQKVYTRIREALEEFAPGSKYMKSWEAAVDELLDGRLSELRSDYPGIKDREMALFIYLAMKLSTPVCCGLLGTVPATFYSMKSRLRSRLAALPDPDRYLMYVDA